MRIPWGCPCVHLWSLVGLEGLVGLLDLVGLVMTAQDEYWGTSRYYWAGLGSSAYAFEHHVGELNW